MNIELRVEKRNVARIFRDAISVFLYLNIPGSRAMFAFMFYFALPMHILFLKGSTEKYELCIF